MGKRTPIGYFIHKTWANMNIRCGKYKYLQTKNKCKTYKNINILFTREEYKNWCYEHKDLILSLQKPSIDRINNKKDYFLENLQIIELKENMRKDRTVFTDTTGVCYRCKQTLPLEIFCKDARRQNGLTNICKPCERLRKSKYGKTKRT